MARGTKENCHGNIMQIPRSEDENTLILTRASFFYFFIQGEYFIQGKKKILNKNIIVFYLFYSKFIILRFLFLFISSCYYIPCGTFFFFNFVKVKKKTFMSSCSNQIILWIDNK